MFPRQVRQDVPHADEMDVSAATYLRKVPMGDDTRADANARVGAALCKGDKEGSGALGYRHAEYTLDAA